MQAIGRGRGSERIQLIKAGSDIAEVSQLQFRITRLTFEVTCN